MASTNTPDMSYRGQHQRQSWEVPNELEEYADGSIVPYYRMYRREENPNADYSPRVELAVKISNAIVRIPVFTLQFLANPFRTTATPTLGSWTRSCEASPTLTTVTLESVDRGEQGDGGHPPNPQLQEPRWHRSTAPAASSRAPGGP
jgi:hypothetical protein